MLRGDGWTLPDPIGRDTYPTSAYRAATAVLECGGTDREALQAFTDRLRPNPVLSALLFAVYVQKSRPKRPAWQLFDV